MLYYLCCYQIFFCVCEIRSKEKEKRFLKSLNEDQICAQYIGFKTKTDIH